MKQKKIYDAVIVGSGAAGGIAAHVLVNHGLDVLLLEIGPKWDPANDYITSHKQPYEMPYRGLGKPGQYDGLWKGQCLHRTSLCQSARRSLRPSLPGTDFHWTPHSQPSAGARSPGGASACACRKLISNRSRSRMVTAMTGRLSTKTSLLITTRRNIDGRLWHARGAGHAARWELYAAARDALRRGDAQAGRGEDWHSRHPDARRRAHAQSQRGARRVITAADVIADAKLSPATQRSKRSFHSSSVNPTSRSKLTPPLIAS